MTNINLRKGITRTLNYTKVIIIHEGELIEKYVKGKTTISKEMKEYLTVNQQINSIPTIELKEVEETRYMTLEKFIQNSEIIK